MLSVVISIIQHYNDKYMFQESEIFFNEMFIKLDPSLRNLFHCKSLTTKKKKTHFFISEFSFFQTFWLTEIWVCFKVNKREVKGSLRLNKTYLLSLYISPLNILGNNLRLSVLLMIQNIKFLNEEMIKIFLCNLDDFHI